MTQEKALQVLKSGANVFLTGEPGAGKSHTIRQYVQYLRSYGVEPAITASTGIAATHIGGMTIHSWSGIGIAQALTKRDLNDIANNDRLVKRMMNTHTLIIDEISMLSANTLGLVEAVCRTVKNNGLPFGGLQVVFVGDFFQLPPVSRPGDPAVEFAFQADAWGSAHPVTCYLSEQHRQEDAAFLEVLASLRTGNVPLHHKERLYARKTNDAQSLDITKLYSHNVDVDRLNMTELNKLPGKAYQYTMEGSGAKPLVEQLQRGCLSPEVLYLKKGAKVMFTKNNFEEHYVNGTTGEVVDFAKETHFPIIQTRAGRVIHVVPESWAIEADGRMLAAITQLPLRLAWAMTIHKSQGMSLDAAYVDLSTAFAYGQGYVALSRVRTLSGLFLGGLNERALQVDSRILASDEYFRSQSLEAEAMLQGQNVVDSLHREQSFIRACGGNPELKQAPKPVAKLKAKEKKGQVQEATLALVKTGLTLPEVAAERRKTLKTIFDHLEALKELNKLPLAEIRHLMEGQEEAFQEIQVSFKTLDTTFLKPVFEIYEGKYDYETIRLARLFL